MTTSNRVPSRRRKVAWTALIVLVLLGVAIAITPALIIQPFKPQTEQGITISYVMRRWSPLLTIVASAVSLLLVLWLWRGASRWWRKTILAILLLPLFASTWFARQNHFEWMFHPLPNSSYARVADANFLTDSDVLLTVNINGEATAYPVRFMGYHHVVQDVVGGTPIVATY